MPVRRLRSLDEAEQSVWLHRDDPRLWPAVKTVWELADRVCSRRFPPGVYKHRTIGDVNRQSDAWEKLDFQSPTSPT